MLSVWLLAALLAQAAALSSSISTSPTQLSSDQPQSTSVPSSAAFVANTTSDGYLSVATALLVTEPARTSSVSFNNKPFIDEGTTVYVQAPQPDLKVKLSTAFTLDLTNLTIPPQCWYPISGNYTQLPRTLFYVTIAAAVLLRSHLPWLYLGALAASLTYSGAAAIHACLLVWRGPGFGELDLLPIISILSTSGIIMVPLINWSSTIRTAGHPELQEHKDDKEPAPGFDAASRVILIFWCFLVTVGYITAFTALQDRTYDGKFGRWNVVAQSGAKSLTCAPESGILNITAGQPPIYVTKSGVKKSFAFMITQDFVDQNNCESPCSNPQGGHAIFRDDKELIPLAADRMVLVTGAQEVHKTAQYEKKEFAVDYAYSWSFVSVYILLQGIWTICFGRNRPSQTRSILYGFFSRVRLSRHHKDHISPLKRKFAQAIALTAYSWSVFIVLVAIPILIITIVALELYLSLLPESEPSYHIGSWSPYASTVLALFAAALAKSYGTIKSVLVQSGWNLWKVFQRTWPGYHKRKPTKSDAYIDAARKVTKYCKKIPEFIFGFQFRNRMAKEWRELFDFLKDPEKSYHEYWWPRCNQYPTCSCTLNQDQMLLNAKPVMANMKPEAEVDANWSSSMYLPASPSSVGSGRPSQQQQTMPQQYTARPPQGPSPLQAANVPRHTF